MISRYPEEISARTRDLLNLSPKMSFGIISLWEYSRKEISLEMTSIDHPRFSWDRIRLHLNRDLYGHLTRDDTLKDVVRDDIRCKKLVWDDISWEISLEISKELVIYLSKIDLSLSLSGWNREISLNILLEAIPTSKKIFSRQYLSIESTRDYLSKYILLETGCHLRDRYQSREEWQELALEDKIYLASRW